MNKIVVSIFAFLLLGNTSNAQENLTYQKPPQEIMQLVDYERAPSVLMDSKSEYIVFTYRNSKKKIHSKVDFYE